MSTEMAKRVAARFAAEVTRPGRLAGPAREAVKKMLKEREPLHTDAWGRYPQYFETSEAAIKHALYELNVHPRGVPSPVYSQNLRDDIDKHQGDLTRMRSKIGYYLGTVERLAGSQLATLDKVIEMATQAGVPQKRIQGVKLAIENAQRDVRSMAPKLNWQMVQKYGSVEDVQASVNVLKEIDIAVFGAYKVAEALLK